MFLNKYCTLIATNPLKLSNSTTIPDLKMIVQKSFECFFFIFLFQLCYLNDITLNVFDLKI